MLSYIKIAFLLLIGLPTALSAQESPIGKVFGPQEGLPQEEYYCVIEARNGAMFLATDQGVFRIVGNEVTQYTTASGLTSNTVFKVMEDPKGRIWALTYDGGVCYFEDEQWVTPKWNESLMDINRATFPYHLMVTEEDYVLVDLIMVDFEIYGGFVNDSVVESITITDEETEGRFHALKIANESMEFNVTLSDFTSRFNDFRPVDIDFPEPGLSLSEVTINTPGGDITGVYYKFMLSDPYPSGGVHSVRRIKETPAMNNGYSYVITGHEMWNVDQKGRTRSLFELPSAMLRMEVLDDLVLVATARDGLRVYRPQRNGDLLLVNVFYSNDAISWIHVSRSGMLWITIPKRGLIRISHAELITNHMPSSLSSLQFPMPFQVYRDTFLTVDHYDLYKLCFTNTNNAELRLKSKVSFPDFNLPGRDYVRVEWYNNSVVNSSFYLHIEDGDTLYQDWTQTYSSSVGLSRLLRFDILHTKTDQNGNFYFTSYSDLYHKPIDSVAQKFEKPSDEVYVENFVLENEKVKWVATRSGLMINRSDSLVYAFPDYPLANQRMTHINQGPFNWNIAGTKESGVLIFNDDTIFTIDRFDQLYDENIIATYGDDERFYVSTDNGIHIIWMNEMEIVRRKNIPYSYLNQIQKVEAFIKDTDLFIQGDRSITRVPESFITRDEERFGYLVRFGEMLIEPSETTSNLDIERGIAQIEFVLSSKRPFGGEGVLWRWRLKENTDWQYTNDGIIRQTNLAPAPYELIVQFRDEFGRWSDVHHIARFTIKAPIIETSWFWLAILSPFILLTLVSFWNANRSRRLHRQLLESNMSSLKMQINPHFIFNSFNSIQYLISKEKNDTASEYLGRLARLIRSNIERPNLHRVSLKEELEYISEFLSMEALRLSNTLEYSIEVDDSVPVERCFLPPMLLQPLLENAVWHGVSKKEENGVIKVKVNCENDYLKISIEDNGDGFPLEKWKKIKNGEELNRSLGLRNVITRLQLLSEMNAKIYRLDLAEGETGTRFVLTLAL